LALKLQKIKKIAVSGTKVPTFAQEKMGNDDQSDDFFRIKTR
jgi:hypothetical protein